MPSLVPTFDANLPAHAVAMVVAADGRLDEQELRVLDRLDAYRRLGVSRKEFLALARQYQDGVGARLCERDWMGLDDQIYHDALLGAVESEDQQLLICRLAAAAITADGCVSPGERLVYDRMLCRWRISGAMVTQAIRQDRAH